MKLEKKHVRTLAKLARIGISEKEIPALLKDLASILSYVDKLASLDTKAVLETQYAQAGVNVWRSDIEVSCDPDVEERLLGAFPSGQDSFLEVQAVFENRTE